MALANYYRTIYGIKNRCIFASVDVHGTYTNVNEKYLVEIVCSVSCVVASGDVMIDSRWKTLFLLMYEQVG